MYIGDYEYNLDLTTPEIREEFAIKYNALKTADCITKLIASLDRIDSHTLHIECPGNPSVLFALKLPGFEWFPFTFLDFNVVTILNELTDTQQITVSQILAKIISVIYRKTIAINNHFANPDIDINEFTDVIMSAIKEIKNVPELNRCSHAFAKIERSLDLLKDQFGTYYGAYAESGDFTIILQSFIGDVSTREGNMTPVLSREFAAIIKYYTNKIAEIKQRGHNIEIIEQITNMMKPFNKYTSSVDDEETSDIEVEIIDYSDVIAQDYETAFNNSS